MPIADTPRAFVDLSQVGVQIAGIALARRYVALRGRDLAQRLRVVGHIGHHHQHMTVEVKGQILGGGQRYAWQCEAFDRRIVGVIDEHHHVAEYAGVGERLAEEPRIAV